jgi:hypothetical protein
MSEVKGFYTYRVNMLDFICDFQNITIFPSG